MERYWLFGGPKYYPAGGLDDFVDAYATIEEAVAATVETRIDTNTRTGETMPYTSERFDWWHVYDTVMGERVREKR